MKIDKIDGNDVHIYRFKKIDEIQEILTVERDKRSELSTIYNRAVNIIGVIDNCLGVTAIWVRYNWSWLSLNNRCSTSHYWNRNSINCYRITSSGRKSSNKKAVLNRKHEKIAMLYVSTLNTISSLILKALPDGSISDEEYSLILLEFETFTRMKEDLRLKSKMSLEKTGNIETEANELLRRNKIGIPT